jgi:serine/threonine protein kinase
MTVPPDDSAFVARIGKTLGGKWRLDRLIGVGGMAAVYAASHRNGAQAAIKILHAHYARRTDARSRFLREAYIANKIGKGAVGVIDDEVDDDGSPYLVMDLLHGEPIDVRMKRLGGKLPLPEVLWIARETLVTLERAHSQGIIHRDLKPDNLFWNADQTLTVLDFGVARVRDASTTETTRTGTVVGTPTFMAPEQALGAISEIDGRTDLWSLGAIMFRLLTGRHVHVGPQANALVIAATKRAPPIQNVDTAIAADVARVIDTSLQFERDKRYPTAQAMREDVEKVKADAPAASKSRFTVPRVSRIMAAVHDPSRVPGGQADASGKPAEAAPKAAGVPPVPTSQVRVEPAERGLASGMSDDDSVALQDLLGLLGDAALARSQHGPADPKTIRKMDMVHRKATAVLADAHIGLFWNVVPEGFVARGQIVWTAAPPLPSSPKAMHDGGIRMLGLLPGVTKAELEDLVRMLRGDLAPFTDYAPFLHSEAHQHLVHRIDPTPPGKPAHESISIEPSSGASVKTMLAALQENEGAALRVTLLSRLERWGEGHENEIGGLLATAELDVAMGLLRVLHVMDTDAARQAMSHATKNAQGIVRAVALGYQGDGERVRAELRGVLEAHSYQARREGLSAIERYKVMSAGPPLALRIRAPAFDSLDPGERRQALTTLAALMPSRAETIAIELLADQRLLPQEDHEATRELAAELLGRIGESREAHDALEAATKKRWRGGDRTRQAALAALAAFEARVKT